MPTVLSLGSGGAGVSPAPRPGATGAGHHSRRANAAVFTLIIILLIAALAAAVVYIARSGVPSPAQGSGPAAPGAAGATTIQQALDAAKVYINEGKFAEASMILDRAIQQFPADQDLRLQYAQALQFQKRWTEAYDQFAHAIAIGPDLAPLHFDAGTIANKAGLVDRAEHHYTLAQTKDTTDPRYPLYLAMIQIKLGKDTEATASLLRVVRLKPDIAEAWGTLAELTLRSGNPDMALEQIARARQLQPEQLRWRLVEARALKRRNEPEKALTLLNALDPVKRADPAVLTVMAECYGLLQKPAEAARIYAEAAAARPRDADTAFGAAQWAQRAGDTAAARRHAKAAADLGHAGARELLATLPQ